jgi:tetratricopeptide (TPR) repeat protein
VDEQAAEQMAKGNRAFREGKFADAEKAYREAFAIKKGYDISGNLGAALLAQGKRREAAQHLAYTLRLFPITGDPALRAQMTKAFDEARKGLGRLHISLDAPGAHLTVDGAPQGESPLLDDVFVEPGEHVVEARLEGFETCSQRATVAADGTAAVSLVLTPVRAPVDTPPPPRRSVLPGIALAGLSALGFGGGIAFISMSSSKRSDAVLLSGDIRGSRGSCVDGAANYDPRCPDLQTKLRADDTYHNTAVASFVIGGAAAAGTALYFLWPQKRAASALQVTPLVGARDGGVLVSGTF